MATASIHDRGRGPEIEGTRVTIDDLLPHLVNPDATEASICRLYDLTPEQVAAARAYVLTAPGDVLERFLHLEARTAPQNPPEVIEKAARLRRQLLTFKEWLSRRRDGEPLEQADERRGGENWPGIRDLPTFKQWLAERESRAGRGS